MIQSINPLFELGSAPHWEVQQDLKRGNKMFKKIETLRDLMYGSGYHCLLVTSLKATKINQ